MDQVTAAGFFDELVKIAVFGPEQAQRVLGVAKKLQLPKASAQFQPGLAAVPRAKKLLSHATNVAAQTGLATGDEVRSIFKESPQYQVAKRRGATIFPGQGSAHQQFSAGGGLPREVTEMIHGGPQPKVPAGQRKMLEAVAKGHELDEIGVRGTLGAAHFGHRSPDVLFREHNRLVRLPPGNEDVKRFMQYYRGPKEAEGLFKPSGLTYGEGPRLSRHARKRLTQGIASRQLQLQEQMKDPVFAQKYMEDRMREAEAKANAFRGAR